MLLTLLFSFVIVNNAIQLSLHPISNRSKGNFMTQILANTKSDQSLIDMFAKLDPAQIENAVTLVQGLLSTSQADLDKITSASTNADEAYVAAVNAHNAATVAQTEGGAVAKSTLEKGVTASQNARDTGITALENTHAKNVEDLQATHDGIVASLKAAFDSTLKAKEEASAAKLEANTILSQEKGRLDKEISSLAKVIALLHGVRGRICESPYRFWALGMDTNCWQVKQMQLFENTDLFNVKQDTRGRNGCQGSACNPDNSRASSFYAKNWYPSNKAFDGKLGGTEASWVSSCSGAQAQKIWYDFKVPKHIVHLRVMNGRGYPEGKATVYASDDGINWVEPCNVKWEIILRGKTQDNTGFQNVWDEAISPDQTKV